MVARILNTYRKTRIPSGIWSRLYGSFPSTLLNTWSKVWPWILIWAYVIWNFAPIFGQQISILDLPYIGLFGPSWSALSPYGWIWGWLFVGFIIDRVTGDNMIGIVRVCLSVCLWALSCLNRLTFDLILAWGSTLTLASLEFRSWSRSNIENCLHSPVWTSGVEQVDIRTRLAEFSQW